MPIIFIDPDEDDQLLFEKALLELGLPYPVRAFFDGQGVLDYLNTTDEQPFLIISEISMPGMSGLELRQQLEQDPVLRRKSIPFIFMTYPVVSALAEQAYELTIQGLFEKKIDLLEWQAQLGGIITYWTACYHPKRVD